MKHPGSLTDCRGFLRKLLKDREIKIEKSACNLIGGVHGWESNQTKTMQTTKSIPSALRELLASKAHDPILVFDGVNQWAVQSACIEPDKGFREVLDRPTLVDYLDGTRYHPAAAHWVFQNARQWYLDAGQS